jgi:hypothetical protein
VPGVAEGNWAYRITEDNLDAMDTRWLHDLNVLYKRGK